MVRRTNKPTRTISLKQFKKEEKARKRKAGIAAERRAIQIAAGKSPVVFTKTTAAGEAGRAARGQTTTVLDPKTGKTKTVIGATVETPRTTSIVSAGRRLTPEELFKAGKKTTEEKGAETTVTSVVKIPTRLGEKTVTLEQKTRKVTPGGDPFLQKQEVGGIATGNILIDRLQGRVSTTIGGTVVTRDVVSPTGTVIGRRPEIRGGITFVADSEAQRQSIQEVERQIAKQTGGVITRRVGADVGDVFDVQGKGFKDRVEVGRKVVRESLISSATFGIKGERIVARVQEGSLKRGLEFVANDPLSAAGLIAGGVGVGKAVGKLVSTSAVRAAAGAAAKKAAASATKTVTSQFTKQGFKSGVNKAAGGIIKNAANQAAKEAARRAALDAADQTARRLAGRASKEAIRAASLKAAKAAATRAANQAAGDAARIAARETALKASETGGKLGVFFARRATGQAVNVAVSNVVGGTVKAPITSVGGLIRGRAAVEATKLPDIAVAGLQNKALLAGSIFAGEEIGIQTTSEANKQLIQTLGGEQVFKQLQVQGNVAAQQELSKRGFLGRTFLDLPAVQSVGEGLGVDSREKRAFTVAVRNELERRGLRGKELDRAVNELLRRRRTTDISEGVGFGLASASTELAGRRIVAKEFNFLGRAGKEITKRRFSPGLAAIGFKELAPLGAIEGAVQDAERQRSQLGKATTRTIKESALFGAVTAGVLGGVLVGTAGAPKVQTVTNIGVNVVDPFEGIGDKIADAVQAGQRGAGIRVPVAGLTVSGKGDTFTFAGTQPKGTRKAPSINIGTLFKKGAPTTVITPSKQLSLTTTLDPAVQTGRVTSIIPTNIVIPPATITPAATKTVTESPVITGVIVTNPIPIITETDTSSRTTTQTSTTTAVPTFTETLTATPLLRSPPPFLPFLSNAGGGAGVGTTKGKKVKFIDELAASQSILVGALGGRPAPKKKPAKKKKRKKAAKKKRQVRALNLFGKKRRGVFNGLF